MTKYKLTLLLLLHFNTKKFLLLFILYQKNFLFFFDNNVLFRLLKVFIIKFKKQIFTYQVINNSLLVDKWFKFGRIDKIRKNLNKLNTTKQFSISSLFNQVNFVSKSRDRYPLQLIWKEVANLVVTIGFSKQKIIFLTQPYLSMETYLLNLHSMGCTSAVRLNAKLKHFLFLNNHDKLSGLANFCFLLSPNEINYKNLSYYRNRYVPIIGVSTSRHLNVMYDKTLFLPHISDKTVYYLLSFILVNYTSGRNISMYYNSQIYYSQVLWFTFRKLKLYKKLFYGIN